MNGQRIGYIRISHCELSPEQQLEKTLVDKSFIDNASVKDLERPELDALFSTVRNGDTVVVQSMDRLARNLNDLQRQVHRLADKGVTVEFVKESLTFTGKDSSTDKLMLSVMGAFAEFERALIRERQREGIALARMRGAYRGRKNCCPQSNRLNCGYAQQTVRRKRSLLANLASAEKRFINI